MIKRTVNRRRFLRIAGFAGVGAGLAGSAWAAEPARVEARPWSWHGVLFGADASITLHGIPEARARQLTRESFRRLLQLEAMFSLFEPRSILCRLNREGRVDRPPAEFVDLMEKALVFSRRTGGVFDVTVQPLWECYRKHFELHSDRPLGPGPGVLRGALQKVGYEKLLVTPGRVSFLAPGMAITLNGIAQGYITDQITDFLKGEGVERTLVNLGEYRAIGGHSEGRPWRLGVAGPAGGKVLDSFGLEDMALAVSAGHGHRFDERGSVHHLVHPKTGLHQPADRTVAVRARTATEADALATACAVVEDRVARSFVRKPDELRIYPGAS